MRGLIDYLRAAARGTYRVFTKEGRAMVGRGFREKSVPAHQPVLGDLSKALGDLTKVLNEGNEAWDEKPRADHMGDSDGLGRR